MRNGLIKSESLEMQGLWSRGVLQKNRQCHGFMKILFGIGGQMA